MNPELAIRPAYDSHDMNPPAHYLLKLQVYNTSPHFGKGVISLMLLIQEGHPVGQPIHEYGLQQGMASDPLSRRGFGVLPYHQEKGRFHPGGFGPDTGRPMPVNTIPGI